MLTCPQCGRKMYSVCSNLNCKCHDLPEGELPLIDQWSLFGKLIISRKLGGFIWNWTWKLNLGYWLEKAAYILNKKYNEYNRKKYDYSGYKMTPFSFYDFTRVIGFRPYQFLLEVQKCPYCGCTKSFDYWEERDIDQLLYEEGVNSLSELGKVFGE